ncbi:hypothetical protein C5167_035421, partial [Papaver somniferum]
MFKLHLLIDAMVSTYKRHLRN